MLAFIQSMFCIKKKKNLSSQNMSNAEIKKTNLLRRYDSSFELFICVYVSFFFYKTNKGVDGIARKRKRNDHRCRSCCLVFVFVFDEEKYVFMEIVYLH